MASLTGAKTTPRVSRKNMFMVITALGFVPYLVALLTDLVAPANLFWLTALSILIIFVGAVGWARSLDEGAMSAHYISWYWGGSLGLMISIMIYIALIPTLLNPNVSVDAILAEAIGAPLPNAGFHAGFMLALLPAVLGYVAWWAIVWARRGA